MARCWTTGNGSIFVPWTWSTVAVLSTSQGIDSDTLWPITFSCLYSSSMLLIGARPMQARRMLSMQARWRNKAFTSGVPRGTSGALHRKLRIDSTEWKLHTIKQTRSSAIAERPRDASCQLKSCQLPCNSAETTYTTSPDQIDGMKLEI